MSLVGASKGSAVSAPEAQHGRSTPPASVTFKTLLLPVASNSSSPTGLQTLCTTSWRSSIEKRYQIAYFNARHTQPPATIAAAKEAAQAELARIFAKTTVLLSVETRKLSPRDEPTCLYPNQGDCGVPRAFGSWSKEGFKSVMPEFRRLALDVSTDDGQSDVVSFNEMRNFGVYQFSFLPKSWISNASLAC